MQTTYKKIQLFKSVAMVYIESLNRETKFTSILEDLISQITPIEEAFQKKANKIRRRLANVDRNQSILRNPDGSFAMTIDNDEKAEEQIEELVNLEEDYPIEPEFAASVDQYIPKIAERAMAGFAIGPDTIIPPKSK